MNKSYIIYHHIFYNRPLHTTSFIMPFTCILPPLDDVVLLDLGGRVGLNLYGMVIFLYRVCLLAMHDLFISIVLTFF